MKHLSNLTPESAVALETAADLDDVLSAAFRGESTSRTLYVLHIADLGAARPPQISGLPSSVQSLDAARSRPAGGFVRLLAFVVRASEAEVDLWPLCLFTLSGGD